VYTRGGAVAQLGARLDGIEEVEGSNPFGSTISQWLVGLPFISNLLKNLCLRPPSFGPDLWYSRVISLASFFWYACNIAGLPGVY
jgi:hypothetical protein